MSTKKVLLVVVSLMVLCLCGLAWAEEDLTKPFEADKDTLHLFHLDDVVAGKETANAAAKHNTAEVVGATAVEGKFGKAMHCDGVKGWADVTDLQRVFDVKALTVECWVKFKDRARGDIICRNMAYMLRAGGTVWASLWLDGTWRHVRGTREIPVGKWTHLAITYEEETKEVKIYVNGALDVTKVPDKVTDGTLDFMGHMLRLGTNDWNPETGQMNGDLDEVRISTVARKYKPLP